MTPKLPGLITTNLRVAVILVGLLTVLSSIPLTLRQLRIQQYKNSQASVSKQYKTIDPYLFPDVPKKTGKVIVKFKDDSVSSMATKDDFHQKFGAKYVRKLLLDNTVAVDAQGADPDEVADKYKKDPSVEYAEAESYVYLTEIPNDPDFNPPPDRQWPLTKINTPLAWDRSHADNIVVAIIDTGIMNHPEIISKVVSRANFSAAPNPRDEHGTHVAGIIGSITNNAVGMAGVGYNVKLMDVQIFGYKVIGYPFPTAETGDVADGIKWATDHGAKIINLSLGAKEPATVIAQAINYAWNSGVLLVCAAGNSGGASAYPGRYENCLSVAAVDVNDNIASFSSRGVDVDIAAPGVAIHSLYGPDSYAAWSGTSMATPHVAGAAALIKALHPDYTNAQIRTQLQSTADRISGTGTYFSNGRLNAGKAVASIRLDMCQSASTAPVNVGPDQTTVMKSYSKSQYPANKFIYIFSNLDNKYSNGVPKPVCVSSGGDFQHFSSDCPSGTYQLAFRDPNTTTIRTSGTRSLIYDLLFPVDRLTGRQVQNIQVNAYFQKNAEAISLSNANCVFNITKSSTIPTPTSTIRPTNTPTPRPTVVLQTPTSAPPPVFCDPSHPCPAGQGCISGFCYPVTPTPTPACTKPPVPTGLTPSGTLNCQTSQVTFSWNPPAGINVIQSALRIDDKSNGWTGTCDVINSGDSCLSISGASYTRNVQPGRTYDWWVHYINSCGSWSDPARTSITIPSCPTPTRIPTPTPTRAPTLTPTRTLTPIPTRTPTVTVVPTVRPTNTPTIIALKPGDANGDGRVDLLDYVVWLSHYGQTAANGPRDGDFNRDSKVDLLDYVIWLTNFGR